MLRLNLDTSVFRNEADLDPESGVCAVRLDEPPSSLLRLVEDRLTVTSSTVPRGLGGP